MTTRRTGRKKLNVVIVEASVITEEGGIILAAVMGPIPLLVQRNMKVQLLLGTLSSLHLIWFVREILWYASD